MPRIMVGTRLAHISEGNPRLLALLLRLYAGERHMVVPHAGSVHIILHSNATCADGIAAYLQACLQRQQLDQVPCVSSCMLLGFWQLTRWCACRVCKCGI